MNDKNYTFEHIEEYLAGELPLSEQKAFEKLLKEDEQLAQQVEAQRKTHRALDIYSQLKTNERIKEIYEKEKSAASLNRRIWLSVAAGLLFLILGATYIFSVNNYSTEAIYSENFDPYPDRITTMGASLDQQMSAALNAYNAKDYEKALSGFTQLPDSIQQTSLVQLYIGVAQLETNNVDSAISIFQVLEAANDNLSEVARWYLALSYLSAGDINNSKDLLGQIVKEETFQSVQAKKIIDKLSHPLRNLVGDR